MESNLGLIYPQNDMNGLSRTLFMTEVVAFAVSLVMSTLMAIIAGVTGGFEIGMYITLLTMAFAKYAYINKTIRRRGNDYKNSLNWDQVYATRLLVFFIYSQGLIYVGVFVAVILENLLNEVGLTGVIEISVPRSGLAQFLFYLYVVLIGPIIEEIVYRYVIITRLRKYGLRFSIIVSTVIFALVHGNIFQSIYVVPMGLLLGYVFAMTNSLGLVILLHILNNGSSVLLERLSTQALQGPIAQNAQFIYGVVMIVVAVILYFLGIERKMSKTDTGIEESTILLRTGDLPDDALQPIGDEIAESMATEEVTTKPFEYVEIKLYDPVEHPYKMYFTRRMTIVLLIFYILQMIYTFYAINGQMGI